MTKTEKNYISSLERNLWEHLLYAQKAYGIDDPFTNRLLIKWAVVHDICAHLCPEYKHNVTPAE